MADVITLSSSEESGGEGEVEAGDPQPRSASTVGQEPVQEHQKLQMHYIDLTDPRWSFPLVEEFRRQNSTSEYVIDLTESDANAIDLQMENLPLTNCGSTKGSKYANSVSSTEMPDLPKSPCSDTSSLFLVEDGPSTHQPACPPKQSSEDAPSCHHTLSVKLTRLPSLETPITDLKKSQGSVGLTKECTNISLCLREPSNIREAKVLRTAPTSHVHKVEHSLHENSPLNAFPSLTKQEQQRSSQEFPGAQLQSKESEHPQSLAESSPSEDKAQYKVRCSDMEQMNFDGGGSNHSNPSHHSSFDSLSNTLHSLEPPNPDCLTNACPISQSPTGNMSTEVYSLGSDSPRPLLSQEGSDVEDMKEECSVGVDIRTVSKEDRDFVCPGMLKKLMARPAQTLFVEEDGGFGAPEVLCRQSLGLVYSTIDVNYPEGTLEQLCDLLQPGYYLPRDITSYLLQGILLNPQCSRHLCVQAFNLLMSAQGYHIADKASIPWDWDLLTSVMANQDPTGRYDCEVVRMLLQYIVQTLEDDFNAKYCTDALQHSIAKATLSCDQQFPKVREVIKWLFSAIVKSTEYRESNNTTRERNELIRMVSIFQRMLSLALEVDCCPALTSPKLSQELFHMVISNGPLRAHRMLLLESLQSKLLRCKLLEHLLQYACPKKSSLPMSLGLVLHFLKTCTLAPDPTDGTERLQKWEELINVLRMLLISYNNAMKGHLCNWFTKQRTSSASIAFRPDDMISSQAVREAVDAFRSRSEADLGHVLPPHVEESLTYLLDHLLDQC